MQILGVILSLCWLYEMGWVFGVKVLKSGCKERLEEFRVWKLNVFGDRIGRFKIGCIGVIFHIRNKWWNK